MKEKLYHSHGLINCFPSLVTKKHLNQSSWKRTIVIETNCDIEDYYRWHIEKNFNLKLNKTLRSSHVTIVNDRITDMQSFDEKCKIFHEKKINFFYHPKPVGDGNHWWLRVWSPEALFMRSILDLNVQPHFNLHLTIGLVNEKNLDHSEYILRQCKKFNILNYSERKPLEDYQLIYEQ